MRSILHISTFLALAITATAQAPKWANYINDHLIYCMALEGDDLWVGSQGGLVKINKVTKERQVFLPANSGVRGFGILSIHVAADGTKWLGGENGGLMKFDGVNWTHYYEVNTGDTLRYVKKVKTDGKGNVWLLARTGLYRFDGTIFHVPFSDHEYVSDFDIAPDGTMWAATAGLIFRYDGASPLPALTGFEAGLMDEEYFGRVLLGENGATYLITSHFQSSTTRVRKYEEATGWQQITFQNNSAFSGYVNFAFFSEDGKLWISARGSTIGNAFYLSYDGTGWSRWYPDDLPAELSPNFQGPDLMYVDEDEHWWLLNYGPLGIHAHKVYELDGTMLKGYGTELFPLAFNRVEDVAVDCAGNTWFAEDGLSKFNGIAWVDYNEAFAGFPLSVSDLEVDEASCKIWAANAPHTNDVGLFSIDESGIITPYYIGNRAYDVEIGPDGSIWLGTYDKGLGHFDGINWTWYNNTNSPVGKFIFNVSLDPSGGVWLGSHLTGLIHFDGINWQLFNESNSPASEFFTFIYADKSGNMWTYDIDNHGLLRYNGHDWAFFPTPSSAAVYAMVEDAYHHYWLATPEGAMFWDGSNFTVFDVGNYPVGGEYTHEISIDRYGNKWMMHLQGVSVYNEYGISNRLINPRSYVQGKVFFDTDQDGHLDANEEPGLPGQPVTLLPENLTTYSSIGGHYKLYPEPGNHQISFQPNAPYVPTTASPLALLMADDNVTGFDFGAWTANPPNSLALELTLGTARCSETTTAWVHLTNTGLLDADVSVTLAYDPLLVFQSAEPAPVSSSGNKLTWEFEGLGTYEYNPIKVIFQNPNADFVGEWLEFEATANLQGDDHAIKDVAATELRCAFDPNDKQVAPTGESVAHFSLLGDALDYTIRFQNKGNDTAFVVVIRDTLDANLDPSSFQLLASSHPIRVTVGQGGVLTFLYEDIDLLWETKDEPNSHGFVKYRISPKIGLPDPTDIRNTAHIFFDFNPAIVTNTTENTLVETLPFLGTVGETPLLDVHVYPNPSNGNFRVEIGKTSTPWLLFVHDAYGRLVHQSSAFGTMAKVEGLPAGFYIITVETGGETFSRKLIVEKN